MGFGCFHDQIGESLKQCQNKVVRMLGLDVEIGKRFSRKMRQVEDPDQRLESRRWEYDRLVFWRSNNVHDQVLQNRLRDNPPSVHHRALVGDGTFVTSQRSKIRLSPCSSRETAFDSLGRRMVIFAISSSLGVFPWTLSPLRFAPKGICEELARRCPLERATLLRRSIGNRSVVVA